nr:metallophosphoesterase [Candidatus Sigynarchaeota archaeon]
MKIGIMSDSHDRLENVEKIVGKFKNASIGAVFHCGDFCSPFVAKKLAPLEGIPFYAVRGNNDGDILFLNANFTKLGQIKENFVKVEIESRKILMLHGHTIPEEQITDIALGGHFDIVLYGHYHHLRNEVVGGKTLVLNPGESCGYLTGEGSAMIVDLLAKGKQNVEIIKI